MKKYVAVGLGVILPLMSVHGVIVDYAGNGNTSRGGAVGNGSLRLNSGSTSVSVTFTRGTGSFGDILVLYIDSKSGGFGNTSQFSDTQNGLTKAISGFGAGRSTATFATGFTADYAIAIGVNQGAALYALANGGTFGDPVHFLHGPFESPNLASYSVNFDWADLGLDAPGANKTFTFESSYATDTGGRYLEGFESATGTTGFGDVTFGNYNSFPLAPVPEPANTALIILGASAVAGQVCRGIRKRFQSRD